MLTDGRTTDGRTTDAGVIGILIAHLGAFGSGELKKDPQEKHCLETVTKKNPGGLKRVTWYQPHPYF